MKRKGGRKRSSTNLVSNYSQIVNVEVRHINWNFPDGLRCVCVEEDLEQALIFPLLVDLS